MKSSFSPQLLSRVLLAITIRIDLDIRLEIFPVTKLMDIMLPAMLESFLGVLQGKESKMLELEFFIAKSRSIVLKLSFLWCFSL